ncbi:MAG: 30S ribosomal protein S16 [Candidatus Paceibacterota bacterium]
MLKIRFFRTGKQHQPYFKIVVTDKDNPPRGGNFKAEVGNYNPRSKDVELDEEKVEHWLEEGAQPSGRVHNLLVEEGIIDGEKEAVHAAGEPEEEEVEEEESQEETEEAETEEEEEQEANEEEVEDEEDEEKSEEQEEDQEK